MSRPKKGKKGNGNDPRAHSRIVVEGLTQTPARAIFTM